MNDDVNMIIFLNKMYLEEINFDDKEQLEKYFQKLFRLLKSNYQIEISGYYEIDIYIDDFYGMILELQHEELEYFGYFDDEIEMQLIIHQEPFLYEIEDYFWIDEHLKENISIYQYQNRLYLQINHPISNYLLGRILENSEVHYKKNCKSIVKDCHLMII